MPLIKEGWADALEPGIREWFYVGFQRRASLIPTLFSVQQSMKDSEHMRGIGAIAPDAWDHYRNSGQVANVSFDEWYKKTFTHSEFVVELPIERTLIEDNLYNEVIDPARQLGDSAALKRETDAASIFNDAFNGNTHTGGDGLSLCNDSHTNGPDKSGTQDNSFALSLTKDNVATVREAMMAFTDDVGNLMAVRPDTILVPPELEDEALEVTRSLLDPTSANNTINPQAGRFSVVTWHYLTDANAWFMIDSILMRQSLLWFERVPLNIVLDRVEKQVKAYYNARMRYSYGFRSWQWVGGSNPS